MSKFRPQITIITQDTLRAARNNYVASNGYETISYPTYKELKRNLKKHLRESLKLPLTVTRSRRGEWGEWFENWTLTVNGKPRIENEGWM